MAPIVLPSNQPEGRFYKGGVQIAGFRGESNPPDEWRSEDWVGSTTCCAGCEDSKLGMTRLPSGELLADAVAADPESWLGAEHIKKHGVDTMLLFKLLDAGQRLPVHAHPPKAWAKEKLGTNHGKAECWHMLTGAEIHLGLKEDVSREQLLEWVEKQDVDALLSRMHKMRVEPRQTVYVAPGMLHAIGEGALIVELQEAADLSILLEWKDFPIDGTKDGHLGLGFPTALTAVDNKARSEEDMAKLITGPEKLGSVVAEGSEEFFLLERVKVSGKAEARRGFAIVVVMEGNVKLTTAKKETLDLGKGKTLVLPFADGDITFEGEGDVMIARPPQ